MRLFVSPESRRRHNVARAPASLTVSRHNGDENSPYLRPVAVPINGAKVKIFAPRIGVNKNSRFRGAEIRCIKVRFPAL
jgi:hypothetical protein